MFGNSKIWCNLPRSFDVTYQQSNVKPKEKVAPNFYGYFRKVELYKNQFAA